MLPEPAALVQAIRPSPTLAMSARAAAMMASGKDVIDLSVGEPDFETPDHIKQAAIEALHRGETRYTATEGTARLREAIIRKFARDNQLTWSLPEILVSCGAKHSLYNLFAATLNPGDEVIIPAPYWVSYPDMAMLVGAKPVILPTDRTEQFRIDPERLAAAITPRTRMLILNSPSNPTGMACERAELEALGHVLAKHPDVLIVSDDIYEHTLWQKTPFCNILMACPDLRDQTIVVNGVSKAYAMTGWRIGYAAGPAWIITAMKKIQSQSTSSPCSISQAAAVAALDGDPSCISVMREAWRTRHDFVITALDAIPGIEAQPGDGTFYTFPAFQQLIGKTLADDLALADFLLDKAGLAVVPGSAFGAPGHLRLSFATSMENLQKAMARLKQALKHPR